MFIERMEERVLLSNSNIVPLQQIIYSALSGDYSGEFRVATGPTTIGEKGAMNFGHPAAPQTVRQGRATSDSNLLVSVTIEKVDGSLFDPSQVLGSFPDSFTFTLKKQNPRNLFTIRQSNSSGEHLLFTGKMNKALTQVTGVLHVIKKTGRAIFSYVMNVPAA